MGLYMQKFEFHLPKHGLCQIWFEIGPVVLRTGFLNIFNIILLFRCYLPFEKGVDLHLNKLESPQLDRAFSSGELKKGGM